MRVILDANVFVSAVITKRGACGKILELWEKDEFDLVVSSSILEEIDRVIHYPKIQQKYTLSDETIDQFLGLIGSQAVIVAPSSELRVIEKDPSDNRYLECAKVGEASFIISGDEHLLKLQEYRSIVILTPSAFLAFLDLERKKRI
jgi:putative PIN family toxin of toxin-antitoxin system